ncbi:MAG: hypothetical protein QOF02_2208 [Blastocatellia bacterium]|jgi:hypothetical protein|nr:hypothetical protein [Blastocatellia bacterium]
MENIVRIKLGELRPEHFEQFPVWALAEDAEDEDVLSPVLDTDGLPDDTDALMVKADFLTPNGLHFKGHVVADVDVYGVALNVGDMEFNFNKHVFLHMPDIAEQTLAELRAAIGDEKAPIFPLTFKTDYRFRDGDLIAGIFDPHKT